MRLVSVNMANSEPITIIWKEYSKVLRAGIWSLFKEQLLVDVSLTRDQSEGEKEGFKVHRFILAVFFNGLKEPLIENNRNQQQINQIHHLNLPLLSSSNNTKENEDVLKVLMEFAYSGTVTVPRHSLENVLLAAQQLGFEGLVNCIKEHDINYTSASFGETDENDSDDGHHPSEAESGVMASSAQSQITVPKKNLRKRRKGIPTKLRKPIGRQCKISSESSAIKEVDCSDDGETISDQSYDVRRFNDRKRKKARKRNACDVFDSDDDVSDNDIDESDGREPEDDESSKSEEDEDWKPTVTTSNTCKSNRKIGVASKALRQKSKTYSCDRCDYTTNDKSTYNNHLVKHDPSIKVPRFTCEFCSKMFKSKKGYRCHMKTHGDPELQFKCDHCPFNTPQKWTWRQHLAVMHKVDESGNPLEDNFACDQCDFTCVALHQLKAHLLRKHTLDKPFKCQQCDYSTITKSELENHISVQHRNERRYMCEMCGFRSQTQNALTRHRRSHLGIKPFKCEQCGMEYSDRGKYKSHLERHTNDEKPFVCHLCGHACHRKDNFKLHMRRIHNSNMDTENVSGSEDTGTEGIFGK